MKTTKKLLHKRRIMSLLLSLMIMLSVAFSATLSVSAESANENVNKVSNSLMQVRMIYTDDKNVVTPIQGGTGFLINSNTVITCAHVVDIDSDTKKTLKEIYGSNYSEDKLSLQVVVSGDVTINATIKKESKDIDFAILNLTEAIYERTSAAIGNTDKVEATQLVFALGFPASVANLQNKNTYTSDDVTITDGKVSKLNSSDGVDYIQHGATLTPGNSGGPLVDENGNVIGINKGNNGDYYYAIDIKQVTEILDALGIEYNGESTVSSEETTVSETEEATTAVVEKETVAPTTIKAMESIDDNNKSDMTKLIIIISIIVLVIILVVVIVLIVINSKKKSAAKIATPVQQRNTIPGQGINTPNPNMINKPINQPRPYNMPNGFANQQNSGNSQTVVSNDGAGETSVLNEGTGETTVLGYEPISATLIRKSNGEKISINKPEFIIGKERRRVDYCISDNNSISRAHAKLKMRAGKCYISDLGSTNCTFVNGTKLSPNQEVLLSKGDKIKISDEIFEFVG